VKYWRPPCPARSVRAHGTHVVEPFTARLAGKVARPDPLDDDRELVAGQRGVESMLVSSRPLRRSYSATSSARVMKPSVIVTTPFSIAVWRSAESPASTQYIRA